MFPAWGSHCVCWVFTVSLNVIITLYQVNPQRPLLLHLHHKQPTQCLNQLSPGKDQTLHLSQQLVRDTLRNITEIPYHNNQGHSPQHSHPLDSTPTRPGTLAAPSHHRTILEEEASNDHTLPVVRVRSGPSSRHHCHQLKEEDQERTFLHLLSPLGVLPLPLPHALLPLHLLPTMAL